MFLGLDILVVVARSIVVIVRAQVGLALKRLSPRHTSNTQIAFEG
jgi:hypothetical protein